MNSNASLSPEDLLGGAAPRVAVGDIVKTGGNLHPLYHVIAVAGDRAWLRDIQHGEDHIVPIDRCLKIEGHRA